jgi:hypothetical protein
LHFVFTHIICEIPIVIVIIHVEGLEELITPKLVPLVLPKIGVGVEVTSIDTITHAYEVFKTPDTILNDALPSPGVNPLKGSPKCSCGKLGLGRRSRLPILERGRGSSWEPRD